MSKGKPVEVFDTFNLMIRHICRRGFAAEERASAPSRSLGQLFGVEVDRVSSCCPSTPRP